MRACSLLLGLITLGMFPLAAAAAEESVVPATHPSTRPSALPSAALPDGLGVNIHFTDPAAGEMEMLAAGGFTLVRMDFAWNGVERKGGEYDFAPHHPPLAAGGAKHHPPP